MSKRIGGTPPVPLSGQPGRRNAPTRTAPAGTRPPAPDVVDRCRKCGQTSTCYATTPPPVSCWARLPTGRACNGRVFDRTPKAAKARPATAAPARRPAAAAQRAARATAAARAYLTACAARDDPTDRRPYAVKAAAARTALRAYQAVRRPGTYAP